MSAAVGLLALLVAALAAVLGYPHSLPAAAMSGASAALGLLCLVPCVGDAMGVITDRSNDLRFDVPCAAPGMSLRDYFAARFITAQFEDVDATRLAKKAYEVADAMLAAREVTR